MCTCYVYFVIFLRQFLLNADEYHECMCIKGNFSIVVCLVRYCIVLSKMSIDVKLDISDE